MQWKKFTITTTNQAIDFVSGLLIENEIDSFEVEDHIQLTQEEKEKMYIDILPEIDENDKSANIIFYLDENTSDKEVEEKLRSIKSGLDELRKYTDIGEGTVISSTTKDEDWINNWKKYFKPFTIDDILIKPTWESVLKTENYKMVIDIDPGTAFGTGLHETTQLCIRQLRKYIKKDTNLLDVGCGSGILSIIARKLGAQSVYGIDIDEAAVKASIENAKQNQVNSHISFEQGNIIDEQEVKDRVCYDKYDIVVANILADVIIPLSKVITPHMKNGALFITSGIINTKEQDVVFAIEKNKELEIKEITRQKDWVSITAICRK